MPHVRNTHDTTRIVHSGSKVPELQDSGVRIFHVCVSFGTSLEMKWIPRSSNSEADN